MLVDDDRDLCAAMESLLNSVGIDVISYRSAGELLEAPLPDRPGCLVLDVRMPGLSGLDLHGRLIENGVDTPIIFLTAYGDITMGVEAMKAGASDFLTKPVQGQIFLDAVSRAISSDLARREIAALSRAQMLLYASLTARERQVFKLVVEGALNKQIAFDLGISEVTVKLHRSNVMKKMRASNFNQLFAAWQALPASARQ